MLTALHIDDFVLIERARLSLGRGLTALTGETGAGKSILLDALGVATGGRAERAAVRHGAKQGVVAAGFEPAADHNVWALLEENGLAGEDDQIILRRVQSADGRSRGFVNDQPVSISLLRRVGEALLEIHGQHDGRGFLSSAQHRGMLDEFAGLEKKAAEVAGAWRALRDVEEALAERRRERDATAREADYLRHIADELHALAPQENEEEELAARRAALMAAENVGEDLRAAAAALGQAGLEDRLSSSLHRLERAAAAFGAEENPLAPAIDKIASALSEAMEARAAVDDAASRMVGDADELETVEERLFALRAAARKHGMTPADLPAFLEKTQDALDALEVGEAAFAELEKQVAREGARFQRGARALSKARVKAGGDLDKAVMKELAPLKLGNAQFSTEIVSDETKPTSDGFDQVEFMVATNPGAPAGPLKTIASGGELSRFVLAMKAALAAKENRTVIIFDEVDAGVGGAVADAVGERLARLAQDAQVLVVTHSPQVAARADQHWRIEKTQSKNATSTGVSMLDDAARREEIARMLSGAEITDEARAAAERLLGAAAPKPAVKRKTRARKARAAG
ncbi:MAG: DNA repair protein RecN [Pseudomonadota bacterium]